MIPKFSSLCFKIVAVENHFRRFSHFFRVRWSSYSFSLTWNVFVSWRVLFAVFTCWRLVVTVNCLVWLRHRKIICIKLNTLIEQFSSVFYSYVECLKQGFRVSYTSMRITSFGISVNGQDKMMSESVSFSTNHRLQN